VTTKFDATNQTVTADISMQADGGASGGGIHMRFGDPQFGGTSSFDDDQNYTSNATKDSITVLTDNEPAVLHSGSAQIVGGGDAFCSDCSFLRWGSWSTHVVFDSGGSPATNAEATGQGNTNVFGHGWWISGDVIDQSDMPTDGSASYTGKAIGDVASNLGDMGWVTYTAKGDMVMTWDFGRRSGDLTISNFDSKNFDGGLTFTGTMTAPGEVGLNQFGGTLSGKDLPDNLSDLTGSANGSFVRGPDNFNSDGRIISGSKPQGVIGNWTVDSSKYTAGGIFGGSRDK
jgi:trimeric autotransporter adhesin